MAYTDDYTKTNWQNTPSVATPLNQTNLNHAEQGIKNNCGRIANLDTTKANQSDLLLAVKNVTFDSTTGTFTFTLFNNTTITVNTDIEKIPVNIDYDDDPTSAHYQSLIIELDDGTYKYVDMSALITQYEFTNTSTIAWTIASDGKVTANVVDGSITASKLQPNYLADCVAAKTGAETAKSGADASALVSEGWAKGKQNGVDVDSSSPYYHNNAEYFKDQAQQAASGQVQADWTEADTTSKAYIQHKPDLTLLQPKALATPITVAGTSQTTVEGALDAINSSKMTISNPVIASGGSLSSVPTNSVGVLTINESSLQPSSGISSYSYICYSNSNGEQKTILATRLGTNETWVNAAGNGYTFNGWTKFSNVETATYTATIPTISGSSATVSVNGIQAGDNPIVDINFTGSESSSTISDTITAWSKVWRITTQANQITVYVTEATSVTIPIQLKVVR